MPSKDFLEARKRGEVAQKYVAEMFKSWGLQVTMTPRGYYPGYDMIISGTLKGNRIQNKVEIKYDLKAQETGNLYLDIPSLTRSQASILIICLGDPIDKTLMLPKATALEFARTRQNARGGEFMEKGCVVPIQAFLDQLKPQVLNQPVAA